VKEAVPGLSGIFAAYKKNKKLPGAETFQRNFKINYDICYKVNNIIFALI
jgi:hypothetical protein